MDELRLDSEWAKRAFLVPDKLLETETDVKNRYYSSASSKFTDSRLGGNIGINARYQFNRYSDIRVNGRLAGRNKVSIRNGSGNHGLGRYMSEVYDDNSRCIYLQFGVPKFNSLINFLRRAMDYESAVLVKSGRVVSPLYGIAEGLTTVGLLMAAPILTIPFLAGKVSKFLFGRPNAKFYTLKPTMTHYWATVSSLVNIMSVNKNIVPKIFRDSAINPEKSRRLNQPVQLDEGYMSILQEINPDMFNAAGMIDVYAVANRAQRLANKVFIDEYDKLENGSANDYTGYVMDEINPDGHSSLISDKQGRPTLAASLNKMVKFSDMWGKPKDKDGKETNFDGAEVDQGIDPDNEKTGVKEDQGYFKKYFENLDALYNDGAEFAVFRVDETGALTDSFSSSAAESDLSNKINGMSADGRRARFTFADGNLLGNTGNVIADTVTGAIGAIGSAAMDTAAGAISGLTMGLSNIPLMLSGMGYVDIPKDWQSSSANLARLSYTMDLVSPYNNAISHMQDIYIPLCMILAGALPRSTGEMSYGAPFICQLYDRGRAQIKTGLIESLSIERGLTTLPFSRRGEALGIRVTFSVLDLSSMMHVPVSSGGIFGSDTLIGENSVIADYFAVLAGMDLASQMYPMSKAKINLMKRIGEASKLTSPAWLAMHSRDISKSLGFGHVIEALSRGSELAIGSMGRS